MEEIQVQQEEFEAPIRQQLFFRAVLCVSISAIFLSTLSSQALAFAALNCLAFTLAYPPLAFFICDKVNGGNPSLADRVFSMIDACLVGATLNLAAYSVGPLLLLTTAIQVQALVGGGLRRWAHSWLAMLVGMSACATIATPNWTLPEFTLSDVGLLGIVVYLSCYAMYLNKRLRFDAQRERELLHKQKELKLQSFKLSKYISPPVWKSIFSGKEVKLETQRKKITTFFSDIKGFSELAEEMEAEALTELLNNYLTEMSNIAIKYGGTIDKYVGDSIMVFFGDPNSRGAKADALACVSMAIAMRKHMKVLQQRWRSQGIAKPLQIRMGINTGYCTVGNFGTESRMDYTLLGKEVNLASRLESLSSPGTMLIAHETYSLIKDVILCRDQGEINVKGFRLPVPVYEVVDFRRDLGSEKTFIEQEYNGFSMYLDSEKIRNYDKEQIIVALEHACDHLREKIIA